MEPEDVCGSDAASVAGFLRTHHPSIHSLHPSVHSAVIDSFAYSSIQPFGRYLLTIHCASPGASAEKRRDKIIMKLFFSLSRGDSHTSKYPVFPVTGMCREGSKTGSKAGGHLC